MVVWRFVRRSRCGRKLHDMSVLPSVGNSQKSRCQRQRKNRLQQQLQALPRITQTQPASQPKSTTTTNPFQKKRLPPSEPRTKISPKYLYAKKKKGRVSREETKEFQALYDCACTYVCMYVCKRDSAYITESRNHKNKRRKSKSKTSGRLRCSTNAWNIYT
jgi:hypothetical protein